MTARTEAPAPRPAEPHSQIGPALRRGWLPVVLCLIIGLAAGWLVHSMVTKKYTASASVLVTPTGVQAPATLVGGRTNGDIINMDTEVQLVTSDSVAKRVKQADPAARRMTIPDLIKPITVTVAANTEVLTIGYESSTAAAAARLANDFATAYLQQRQADAQATITAQLNRIRPEAAALSTQLRTLSDKLDQLPNHSAQISFVRAQVASLKSRVNSFNSRISSLSTTVVTPGQIRSSAGVRTAKVGPSRTIFLATGAAIGLLIGLLIAWLRLAVRRRLRDADDVINVLDLPVLATVAGNGTPATDSRSFQDYRRIANVVSAAGESATQTVLVTGQRANSTGAVAGNLLRAFRLSSLPTALMPTSRTIAETLGSDPVVREALIPAPPAGAIGADDVTNARGSGCLIAVAPDPRYSADAQTLARFSDAAVIVIDKGTRTKVAEEILRQLDAVGAPVLGVVLVRSRHLGGRQDSNEHGRQDGKDDVAPRSDNASPAADAKDPDDSDSTRPSDGASTGRPSTQAPRKPATSAASRRKQ